MIRIRRYYGHDCNSWQGFNDGHYIDSEPIEAESHEHAMQLCREALAERWDLSKFHADDLTKDDDGYQLITRYSDGNGNRLTKEEYDSVDESDSGYLYVFVNYTEEE